MVAYSFKQRFIDPIRALKKRQTMRNERNRHARPGEQVQLYYAMRTVHCFLIGRATCTDVQPVRLNFKDETVRIGALPRVFRARDLDYFAVADGFADWRDLTQFWNEEHDAIVRWSGVIILWTGLVVPA